MGKPSAGSRHKTSELADGARAAGTATTGKSGGRGTEARRRFVAALEIGNEFCSRARKKTAKVADAAVRGHPYQVVGIAFGVGALLGDLIARRRWRNGD